MIINIFAFSDPLFRQRTSIYGYVLDDIVVPNINLKCLALIAFSVGSKINDLNKVFVFGKKISDYLASYVSRYLDVIDDRIVYNTPSEGAFTFYMARR